MKKTITLLLMVFAFSFYDANAQEPYLGDIKLTAINFEQRGWAECNGQLLSIASNTALFSLLGTTYGGDGETTFALPDLRGRVPVHNGQGPGLTNRRQGQVGGTESNTLTVAQMPTHTHTINAVSEDGNQSSPIGNMPAGTKLLDQEYSNATAAGTMNSEMVNSEGGNQSVNNMQPYAVVKYVIALQGLFPSPN